MQDGRLLAAEDPVKPGDGQRISPALHADRINRQSSVGRHPIDRATRLEYQPQTVSPLQQPFSMEQHGRLLSADRRAGFCHEDIHADDSTG
jgi:hypothetical protein